MSAEDLHDALRRQGYRDEVRRRAAVEQLWAIAARNPVVYAHLSAWRAGAFPTFEDALAALCVDLTAVNDRLQDELVRRARVDMPPIVTPVPAWTGPTTPG